eukprot:CAMPEP_0176121362 /NCGR_PEP_ID=MMETSP0120_2-20121206/61083_1 /TAXON_ID=160619 /ORGANISM="Kryptoperidinium foliaceum, Strain CCMP 1326" /LENGTH=68 /DNA_ID=CAMNT_0017455899 /DNA_START=115 /DNA_END=317 /DNA_ORIENTATION=-
MTDVFVRFAKSFSGIDAAWYSLKPLGMNTPYIGDLMGLSSDDTFAFLNIIGLGSWDKNGKFLIKRNEL